MDSRAPWPLFRIFAVCLLAVSLVGCRGDRTSDDGSGDEFVGDRPAVLRNTDTNVSITVPAGWIKIGEDIRRSHDIYAAQPNNQLYASVLSEGETGLDRFGLADNSNQYRQLIRDGLDGFEGETKTSVTRVNGLNALQYEMRGSVDGEAVVYLHTTIEGADDYYQVVGWTNAERYGENKAVLESVVESFEGT